MTDTPNVVVRRWFKEVWDDGREESIDDLMAPYCMAYGLPGGPLQGPTAFRTVFHTLREALGDLSVQVLRTVAEGDQVAAYCHVTGTHVGVTLGGEPTGKPVDFCGMTILRVEDGKIAEAWNAFEFLTMYQQIGWVANPPLPQQPPAAGPPL